MSAESWANWFDRLRRKDRDEMRLASARALAQLEEWEAPMNAPDTRIIVDSFLRKITVTRKWED